MSAIRIASPNGIFDSISMGSNTAGIVYVTCGSRKVAWSAAMMKSTWPSR